MRGNKDAVFSQGEIKKEVRPRFVQLSPCPDEEGKTAGRQGAGNPRNAQPAPVRRRSACTEEAKAEGAKINK